MIGIYKITSPSNRIYIGQSTEVETRIKEYGYIYKSKKQTRLHASFIKHGVENHVFEILQECTIAELNDRERYWQDFYNVTGPKGLNCDLVDSTNAPKKRSAETKNKIAKKLQGHTYNLGRKFTGETLLQVQKGSKARIGIPLAESTKKLLREANLGKKATPEARKNMSIKNGMSKIVLNLETGIFHSSVKEVSVTYSLNQNVLIQKLGRHKKNNTQFTYI